MEFRRVLLRSSAERVAGKPRGARKNLRLLKWLKQTQSASVGRSKTIFDEGEIVMASTGDQAGVKPARNWWKIGFFVMLIMFEAASEWAVAMTYEPPKVPSGFYVGRVETLVSATGRWKRTDKIGRASCRERRC